jgi:hypothetical protein
MTLVSTMSFVFGAMGAVIGWIAFEFVAKPIRGFYDLRREASRVMAKYHYDNMFDSFSAEAKADYKSVGAALVAFANSEAIASRVIRLRYDPRLAGDALLAIASKWGDALGGWEVRRGTEGVRQALKLPD